MFSIYTCRVLPQVEATLGAYLKQNLEARQANIFSKTQPKTCILDDVNSVVLYIYIVRLD